MRKSLPSSSSSCSTVTLTTTVTILLVAGAVFSSTGDDELSRVEFLPGFNGGRPLPFELYTGYIGVSEKEQVQLFYYFVKSESNPKEDPLILWLTGGPGCSSLTGLLYEFGPLEFEGKEYNGSLPTLLLAPNSLTKVANVIFLDQPARSGFSYATTPGGAIYSDLEATNHVYQFLQKWFSKNPEFQPNEFYVGGDSYSGITVPIITQLISDGNEALNKSATINLKGYFLGNPKTFPEELNYAFTFAHGMGLISNELYTSIAENCKEEYEGIGWRNELCSQSFEIFMQLLDNINKENILEPLCGSEDALRSSAVAEGRKISGEKRRSLGQKLTSSDNRLWCLVDYHKLSDYWANDHAVQEALHVRKGTIRQWLRCRQSINSTTYIVTTMDTREYHANLSRKGYKSLIYSGDHDTVVPFQSTEAWIKALNYTITDEWRQWTVNNQIAGYTRSFSNHMTFATVKGAGHTAFEYKREECIAMATRWLFHKPL